MTRPALAGLLAAAALAAAAAPAPAATVTCEPGEYQLVRGKNPEVTDLQARNLPRKTSGYAPRCLVAEAIAADVQRGVRAGEPPKTIFAYGARWSAGKWRCSYPEGRAACHRKGKPKRRVTMDLT